MARVRPSYEISRSCKKKNGESWREKNNNNDNDIKPSNDISARDGKLLVQMTHAVHLPIRILYHVNVSDNSS